MIREMIRAIREGNLLRQTVVKLIGNISLFTLGGYRVTLGDLIMKRRVFDNVSGAFLAYDVWRRTYKDSVIFKGYPRDKGFYDFLNKDYIGKMDRIAIIGELVKMSLHIPGDIAEFGVFKGHTAAMILNVMKKEGSDKTLYLFDSFQGLPDSNYEGDEYWNDGIYFKSTLAEQVKILLNNNEQVEIVEGFFSDTLKNYQEVSYSFCHLDVDIYPSVIECFEYIYPRLRQGSIIAFDDYGFPACIGAKKAVDELIDKYGISILTLPTGQAIYFHNVNKE